MTTDRPTDPPGCRPSETGVFARLVRADAVLMHWEGRLAAVREAVRARASRTFRERQILIRTEEGVRHWRLTPRHQLLGASALAGLVLWGVAGSAGWLGAERALEGQRSDSRVLELEYAQLIAEMAERSASERTAGEHTLAAGTSSATPDPVSEATAGRMALLEEQVAGLEAQLALIDEQRSAALADRDALAADLAAAEAAAADARDRLDALTAERDALLSAVDAATAERDTALAAAAAAEGRADDLAARLARRDSREEETDAEVARLSAAVEAAQGSVDGLSAKRDALTARLGEREATIAALRDRLERSLAVAAALSTERDRLATDLGETTGHRDRLARQVAERDAALVEAEAEIAALEAQLRRSHMAAVGLATDRDRLATENGMLQGDVERLTAAVARARAQNTDLASLVAEAHLASARLDAESERLRRHNAVLTQRVGTLQTDLAEARGEQERVLAGLRERANRHVSGLEGGLQLTRLDLDDLLERMREEEQQRRLADASGAGAVTHAALGGPMIPGLPEEEEAPADLPPMALDLVALFDRAAELTTLAERLPLSVPLLDEYEFTSGFGMRADPFNGRRSSHFGLDFAAPTRTPIYAPSAGVVVHAGRRGAYGNLVEIDHGMGLTTRFAHLHEISVEEGQEVRPGDPIGLLGSTGRSTGPHLHYEIRIDDQPVNPMNFVRAGQHVLEIAEQE